MTERLVVTIAAVTVSLLLWGAIGFAVWAVLSVLA